MAKIGINPRVAKTRSNVGVASRSGDPERIKQAAQEHAEAKIADYIEQTVASAPELTAEQCSRLAALLLRGVA